MNFALSLLSKFMKSEWLAYLGLGILVFGVSTLIWTDKVELAKSNAQIEKLESDLKHSEVLHEQYVQVMDKLQLDLNNANSLARARGADIERLRNANAKLQARIATSPKDPNAEALARCSALLTEGAGLVTEGEGLLLKHGITHDSLVEIKK